MFSLFEIEQQIEITKAAAAEIYAQADEETNPLKPPLMRCYADGLSQAARSLEQMVTRTIEREFRDAVNRA